MIIYQICPSCGYQGHISLFGRRNNGWDTYLICPKCGEKFLPKI